MIINVHKNAVCRINVGNFVIILMMNYDITGREKDLFETKLPKFTLSMSSNELLGSLKAY